MTMGGILAFSQADSLRGLAALLDASAKGLVLLTLAAGATLLLRRASAAARHMVWTLAVAGLLCVPGLSVAMPQWSVPVPWLASPGDATTRAPSLNDPPQPLPGNAPPLAAAQDPVGPDPEQSRSDRAPRLCSGSLRLPHLGDCTQEGHPAAQVHSAIRRRASPQSSSKRV